MHWFCTRRLIQLLFISCTIILACILFDTQRIISQCLVSLPCCHYYDVITLFSDDYNDLYCNEQCLNPLMPGGNKKVTPTEANLQLIAAGLFKHV